MTTTRDMPQTTPWFDPRHDGQGHWQPTPRPSKVAQTVDFLIATIALTLAITVFLALVALGRAAMCAANSDSLRYCPGYHATTSQEPAR